MYIFFFIYNNFNLKYIYFSLLNKIKVIKLKKCFLLFIYFSKGGLLHHRETIQPKINPTSKKQSINFHHPLPLPTFLLAVIAATMDHRCCFHECHTFSSYMLRCSSNLLFDLGLGFHNKNDYVILNKNKLNCIFYPWFLINIFHNIAKCKTIGVLLPNRRENNINLNLIVKRHKFFSQ